MASSAYDPIPILASNSKTAPPQAFVLRLSEDTLNALRTLVASGTFDGLELDLAGTDSVSLSRPCPEQGGRSLCDEYTPQPGRGVRAARPAGPSPEHPSSSAPLALRRSFISRPSLRFLWLQSRRIHPSRSSPTRRPSMRPLWSFTRRRPLAFLSGRRPSAKRPRRSFVSRQNRLRATSPTARSSSWITSRRPSHQRARPRRNLSWRPHPHRSMISRSRITSGPRRPSLSRPGRTARRARARRAQRRPCAGGS